MHDDQAMAVAGGSGTRRPSGIKTSKGHDTLTKESFIRIPDVDGSNPVCAGAKNA
jgi:hypothetical protein